MPTPLDTRHTTRWLRYGIIAATAVGLLIGVILYFWQSEPEQAALGQEPTHTAGTVFGPGAWTEPSANPVNYNGLTPPGGLTVTDNQELVINLALLDVINFFLLEQSDEDRASELNSYLKSKLPPPAYAEAVEIVEHYQAYMKEHDEFLAGQNLTGQSVTLPTVDINRINTWREQRDRLRQRILGDKVVQAWYQNDDSQLTQILEELPQLNGGTDMAQGQDPSSPNAAPFHPAPHYQKKSDEIRHNQYMQNILDKATKSFSARSKDGQQWAIRYTAYLNAANQINQDTSINASERSRQIQELLMRSFPTDAERQHARDRGL